MWALAKRLRKDGFTTHIYSYPSTARTVDEHAAGLRDLCNSVRATPLPRQLHFVAHSLGGLVVLRMLQQANDLPPGRIALLGTAMRGSAVARRVADWAIAGSVLGKIGGALERGAGLLPHSRDVGIVEGTTSIGVGRIAGRIEKPNDGVVMVPVSEPEIDPERVAADLCDRIG